MPKMRKDLQYRTRPDYLSRGVSDCYSRLHSVCTLFFRDPEARPVVIYSRFGPVFAVFYTFGIFCTAEKASGSAKTGPPAGFSGRKEETAMLKLPLCPYCNAEFLYPTVKKNMGNKTGSCPHCGRRFRIVRKNAALLFTAAALVLVGCNLLLLRIESMNLLFLTAVTAGGVAGIYYLIPYTVRYRPLR